MPAYPCQVLICEDNLALLEDFAALLRADTRFHVVKGVSSGNDAIHLLKNVPIDLLVIDLGLPDVSGLDVLRSMRGWQPRCEGLVVTMFADEETVIRAIEAGASGYVLKREASFSLLRRIEELLEGGSPITPSIARFVLSRMQSQWAIGAKNAEKVMPALADARSTGDRSQDENCDEQRLSEREVEVLQMVAKGLSVQEVGNVLGLSSNTIKTYIRRIYKKLAVNSRIEAIYEARAMGLLDPGATGA
jgi:DNA-binding NarL/FixJ family response regulator